ncbi:MAG: hypothetical protein BMS9Abin20_0855 [Acidimicrobiia bacterium]|nr:MAG: hypothetical protein BMS9Abin20_0855 [Acidimicrobiia bacterium]
MKPLTALFAMSLRQALPLRRTIMLALIQLAPVGIYLFSTTNRTSEAAFDALIEIGTATLFALTVPVVAIVIGASAFGVERRDQTLSFVVLRPISRTALASIKTTAAVVGAFGINLIGAVALGAAHSVRYGDPIIIAGLVVGVFIATAVYVSVMVPLGFLTDRGVIIGLAYLLVFENGVTTALPALATLSPWRSGLAALGAIVDESAPIVSGIVGSPKLTMTQPLTALIVSFVAGVAITAQMLRQRDLA